MPAVWTPSLASGIAFVQFQHGENLFVNLEYHGICKGKITYAKHLFSEGENTGGIADLFGVTTIVAEKLRLRTRFDRRNTYGVKPNSLVIQGNYSLGNLGKIGKFLSSIDDLTDLTFKFYEMNT